jgi:dihydrolipoamide dehydrogenase
VPFEVPGISFDGIDILSSTDVLSLKSVPKSILIVGGGVIGCEFASILRTFGSEVAIVEMMEQLLPNEDAEISRKLTEVFKKRGISIYTGTKVEGIEKKNLLKAILSRGVTVDSEKALVCVGRSPNSKDLGLETIGVSSDKGWINVDEDFRTNIDNIYAAGDVKGGMLLAHVASREGICAVEAMLGKKTLLDYRAVPNCIFTEPEIASVGLSVKAAKAVGLSVRSRKFLFSAIGKAHVIGETEGFIKMVVNDGDDRILGAQIIGPHATELIAEIALCVQLGITSEKLAGVIHAHPTLSEAIQEVASSGQ